MRSELMWTRRNSDITDEEYKEFYQQISSNSSDPILWSHNYVEGKNEYISLLYIPSCATSDLWDRDCKHGLRLYIQHEFIMDNAAFLMPNYLRFVCGLIDSADFPLNISREILQDSRISENVRNACSKRVLKMLSLLASDDKEKYQQLWEAFGQILKEGIAEDRINQERIAQLLRFASTYTDSNIQNVSLEEYISRMADGQKNIYFITADSYDAAKSCQNVEKFRNEGIEVLLLFNPIDEWMMSYLTEFGERGFQSVND